MFSEEGPGTREEFENTYGSDEPLGSLIRQIVGLDRNAAKSAFANFLTIGQYTADQIRFVDLIIDHLVSNGIMDPKRLFERPFTDFHDQGVAGVLGEEAGTIIELISQINNNAVTA